MKSLLSATALAAAALFASAPASAAITLTFTSTASHINVGETVDVTATISGLDAEILSAFDLNFIWDASILSFSVFSFQSGCNNLGPTWTGDLADADCSFESVANGNIGAIGFSWLDNPEIEPNQADSFVIATYRLNGTADGLTYLTLGANPDFERNFVGLDPDGSLAVDVGRLCIAVGSRDCGGGPQVPEPGTYGLAALGLLAAGAARRRARR